MLGVSGVCVCVLVCAVWDGRWLEREQFVVRFLPKKVTLIFFRLPSKPG